MLTSVHKGQLTDTIPLPLKQAYCKYVTCGIFTFKLPNVTPEPLNAKSAIIVAVGISTKLRFGQLAAKFMLTICSTGKSSVVNNGQPSKEPVEPE